MTRQNQKQRESDTLRLFRELVSPDLDGVTLEPSEEPDFVSTEPSLGVEIARYYQDAELRGSPAKRSSVERARTLERARQVYDDEFGPSVAVSVHWTARRPQDTDDVARDLAGFVLRHAGTASSHRELPACLATYIRCVGVTPLEGRGSTWHTPMAKWQGDEAVALQAVLDSKEPKMSAYRDQAQELWLVVEAAGEILHSQIIGFDAVTGQRYQSSADRVYVVDRFIRRCARLRIG